MIGEKLRDFYENDMLVQRTLKRLGYNPIQLDALQIAKIVLIGKELELFYREGLSDNDILQQLGSAYTLEDINDLTNLIWGKTPDEMRFILHTRTLS